MKKISLFLKKAFVSGFFTGYIPFMPGTFGSLIGILLFYFFYRTIKLSLLPVILLLYLFGVIFSDFAEKQIFKLKDPEQINIDEICGVMVALYGNPYKDSLLYVSLTFILFRTFDIIKPFPLRDVQKIKGGTGIMLDDFLAAIYTILCVYLFSSLFRLLLATS